MTPILMYHNIGDPPAGFRNPNLYVSVSGFEAQLRWLSEAGYRFLDLDEFRADLLGEAKLPRRSVVLTFDDGFEDNFIAALPLLQKYGARAVFFPISGSVGATDPLGRRYMDASQLRTLAAAGMQIGSHTATHTLLAKLSPETARGELSDSRATLEQILGAPVRWLCYPRGNLSHAVAQMAAEEGYAGACSAIRGNRPAPRQLYWLPRVMVLRETSPSRLKYSFGLIYELIHHIKNRSRWKDFQ